MNAIIYRVILTTTVACQLHGTPDLQGLLADGRYLSIRATPISGNTRAYETRRPARLTPGQSAWVELVVSGFCWPADHHPTPTFRSLRVELPGHEWVALAYRWADRPAPLPIHCSGLESPFEREA